MRTEILLRVKVWWDEVDDVCCPKIYYVKNSGVFPAYISVEEGYIDVIVPVDAEKIIVLRYGKDLVINRDEFFKRDAMLLKAFIFDVNELPTADVDAIFAMRDTGFIYKTWTLSMPGAVLIAIPYDENIDMIEIKIGDLFGIAPYSVAFSAW